jgi:hypothetical protein
MRRSALLVALAGAMAVLAAAARTSPTQAPPAPPAATVTARTGENAAPVQVRWLETYGTFNVRQGTWNFFPKPEGC